MDPIYVTGHRNPDTDSIVAAISYAALRNACGDREYEAACLGRVSDETQIVLDRFGFLPPKRITDLYNQVRDLDFDKPPILSGGVTMGRAWDEFQAYPAIASIPVVRCSTPSPFWRAKFSTMREKAPTPSPARSRLPCPRAGRICCSIPGRALCSAATSRT